MQLAKLIQFGYAYYTDEVAYVLFKINAGNEKNIRRVRFKCAER